MEKQWSLNFQFILQNKLCFKMPINLSDSKKSLKSIFHLVAMFILMHGIKSVDCIECYACGLSVVDPIEDGYSYNLDPDDHKGRMFNETCIVFESYLLDYPNSMNKWIRSCP